MARFCWRERSERINWRFLRELPLADVVRRGDATLLEPYALHLTFAKLPVVATSLAPTRHDVADEPTSNYARGDEARNAWFIVRVFQLAMEYLLFLRARDGTVVDSLRQELLVCERECELLMERAKKWKDRSRSGDKQVEKLHQVLQSIAKLLQIEGATPSAVTTIESLLRDLIPSAKRRQNEGGNQRSEPSESRIDEARVCSLCGKMFSSEEFLDKHLVRRHPGVDLTTLGVVSKKQLRQPREHQHEGRENRFEDHSSAAQELKRLLNTVELTLQEHQTTLRRVAQEEASKIHSLYGQLHIETQLADELRAKRVAMEAQVDERRRELEQIDEEKERVAVEIKTLTEQLEFLAVRNKLEVQSGVTSSSTQFNSTYQLELKRLEETIAGLREALTSARMELQHAHESNGVLLKEKYELETQLHEARNHARRLKASLHQDERVVPSTKVDSAAQITVTSNETSVQTETIPQSEPATLAVVPSARTTADEASVQTDQEEPSQRTDSTMQTDPLVMPATESLQPARSPTTSIGVGVDVDILTTANEETDSVFYSKCKEITALIHERAERVGYNLSGNASENRGEKPFSSLPRRRYLRSRFLHDEAAVKERITSHVATLEHTSLRFGVSAKNVTLANQHIEIVQRALHAHLEVLPAEVLERMIDIESTVSSLIHDEWMPEEKSRQQALERLTSTMEAKSQVNRGLIRQAMAAFASTNDKLEEIPHPAPQQALGSPDMPEPPTLNSSQLVAKQEDDPIQHGLHVLRTDANANSANGSPGFEGPFESEGNASNAAVENTLAPTSTALSTEPQSTSSNEHSGVLPPESVQEIRRQAIAVRPVKVVSVSPKSSPPKPPPTIASAPSPSSRMEEPTASSPAAGDRAEGEPIAAQVSLAAPSSIETEPIQPTLPAMQRGLSSFSTKHPESQLGIVIPSRYDPSIINVHGLRDDSDNAIDYRQSERELQWSSSAGRSGEASEPPFSAVASSEMSFAASIPSLGSDGGVGHSPSSLSSSTRELPQLPTIMRDDDHSEEEQGNPDPESISEIQAIPSIQEEGSDSDNSSTQQLTILASSQRHSPLSATHGSQVVGFDDDSDIEEVVLS